MEKRKSLKEKLSAVIRQSSNGFIKAEDVEKALNISKISASQTLSSWAKQGWLQRVYGGIYLPVPMGLDPEDQILDSPWFLAAPIFSKYYIGGLSAANHWGLTEQTFRSSFIFITQPNYPKEMVIQDYKFIVKTISEHKMFGHKPVRVGSGTVEMSNISKTLIDMLDDPSIGGGGKHVFYCFKNFLEEEKRRRDRMFRMPLRRSIRNQQLAPKPNPDLSKTLIKYAKKFKNGAVFKRLGFFAEKLDHQYLIEQCKKNLTTGYSKLDPSSDCDRYISKWNLLIPDYFEKNIND